MKKLAPAILILILVLAMTGCGKAESSSSQTVKSIDFTAPEGFTQTEDNIWDAPDENDTSNINYSVSDKDSNFKNYTAKSLEDTYENAFAAQEYDIDVKIDSFEFTKISECDAIRVQCSYIYNDVNVIQIQYIIDADKTYIYTFTNMGDADWIDAFDKAGSSIELKYE